MAIKSVLLCIEVISGQFDWPNLCLHCHSALLENPNHLLCHNLICPHGSLLHVSLEFSVIHWRAHNFIKFIVIAAISQR